MQIDGMRFVRANQTAQPLRHTLLYLQTDRQKRNEVEHGEQTSGCCFDWRNRSLGCPLGRPEGSLAAAGSSALVSGCGDGGCIVVLADETEDRNGNNNNNNNNKMSSTLAGGDILLAN